MGCILCSVLQLVDELLGVFNPGEGQGKQVLRGTCEACMGLVHKARAQQGLGKRTQLAATYKQDASHCIIRRSRRCTAGAHTGSPQQTAWA